MRQSPDRPRAPCYRCFRPVPKCWARGREPPRRQLPTSRWPTGGDLRVLRRPSFVCVLRFATGRVDEWFDFDDGSVFGARWTWYLALLANGAKRKGPENGRRKCSVEKSQHARKLRGGDCGPLSDALMHSTHRSIVFAPAKPARNSRRCQIATIETIRMIRATTKYTEAMRIQPASWEKKKKSPACRSRKAGPRQAVIHRFVTPRAGWTTWLDNGQHRPPKSDSRLSERG